MVTCMSCKGTGVIETGNNDLPCTCPAGDRALFYVVGSSEPMTGFEMRARLHATARTPPTGNRPEGIQVLRNSYYDTPSGHSLNYVEADPHEEHPHEGLICGCTTAVTQKPQGKPANQTQDFSFISGDFSFSLTRGHATFRELGHPGGHAYFWYRMPETSIQVEITLPGYRNGDHFFANLMQGNAIDVSRLFNGHSPSKVLEMDKLSPEDLYVHRCSIRTGEAMRFFENPEEKALWKETFRLVDLACGQVLPYAEDYETPVEVLRARMESDSVIVESSRALRDLLDPIQSQLRKTELFRLGDQIQ